MQDLQRQILETFADAQRFAPTRMDDAFWDRRTSHPKLAISHSQLLPEDGLDMEHETKRARRELVYAAWVSRESQLARGDSTWDRAASMRKARRKWKQSPEGQAWYKKFFEAYKPRRAELCRGYRQSDAWKAKKKAYMAVWWQTPAGQAKRKRNQATRLARRQAARKS